MGDHRRPSRLMRSAETLTGVAVEVFVEEDVVTPVRILGVAGEGAVAGPRPVVIRHEQGTEPLREFVGHAIEVYQLARSGRAFDPEGIAVIAVILAQSLDQQEVDGEPDRPTLIRVPTEMLGVHVPRHVGDRILLKVPVGAENVRAILVNARQGPDAVR